MKAEPPKHYNPSSSAAVGYQTVRLCRWPLGPLLQEPEREAGWLLRDAPCKPGRWPRGERGCRHLVTLPKAAARPRGRLGSGGERGSFATVPSGTGPAPPPLCDRQPRPRRPARFMWPVPRRPLAGIREAAAAASREAPETAAEAQAAAHWSGRSRPRPSSGRPAAACAPAGGCCGCRAALCSPRSSSSRSRPRCSTPCTWHPAKVHALNILRALFRDTHLGENIIPYVADGAKAAILGFTSPVWAVRNSSTLLFSSLITRIFGVKRGKDELSKTNRVPESTHEGSLFCGFALSRFRVVVEEVLHPHPKLAKEHSVIPTQPF
ncbi:uncharacterized protein LOC144372675 [Ictidomys tridecemlineatus]